MLSALGIWTYLTVNCTSAVEVEFSSTWELFRTPSVEPTGADVGSHPGCWARGRGQCTGTGAHKIRPQ